MSCLWGIPPTPVTEDECSTLWRSRGFQPSSFSLHKTTAWSQPPVTNCVPLLHGKNWMLLIIPLSWGLSFRNSTPAFWTCTGNRLRLRAIRKKITIRLHKWMQLHANSWKLTRKVMKESLWYYLFRSSYDANLWSTISTIHCKQGVSQRMPCQVLRPPPCNRWLAIYSMTQVDSKPAQMPTNCLRIFNRCLGDDVPSTSSAWKYKSDIGIAELMKNIISKLIKELISHPLSWVICQKFTTPSKALHQYQWQ